MPDILTRLLQKADAARMAAVRGSLTPDARTTIFDCLMELENLLGHLRAEGWKPPIEFDEEFVLESTPNP